MNEFIERNRGLLRFYCVVARIIGWLILVLGGIYTVWYLLEPLWSSVKWEALFPFLPHILKFMLGLIVLGVAQFMRYLFDSEYKPGLILRYGDKILYIFAVVMIGQAVWQHVFTIILMGRPYNFYRMAPWHLLVVLFIGAKMLVLVGLAQIMQRIMPVIEESKTLV